MEEILHHLKRFKFKELQQSRASRWCKVSSINNMFLGGGCRFRAQELAGADVKGIAWGLAC